MQRTRRNTSRVGHLGIVTIFAIACAWQPAANAGGFQVTELCGKCQGMRNAGAASNADHPSTVYFNPAGLAWLEGQHLDVSAHFITGQFEFTNRGTTNAFGGEATGRPVSDGAEDALVGNLYYAMKINDKWAVGLGVNIPYGLTTEYDDDWIGRYNAIKADLKVINVNPAISWRINDEWAIGLGVVGQYSDAEITNSIDTGAIISTLAAGLLPPDPGNPELDAFSKLKGDDTAFGFNLGVMWQPRSDTRIGLGFRSEVSQTLEGDLTISPSEGLEDFLATLPVDLPLELPLKENGEADIDYPMSIWFGVTHHINERWRVMGGYTWTDWEKFDELRIKLESGTEIVEPEDWSGQSRFGIGFEFDYTQNLTFRMGTEYDESPVSAGRNTPRIPDEDRSWLAFGLSWSPVKSNMTLDFAYTHIFLNDYTIVSQEVLTGQTIEGITGVPNDIGTTLSGEYEADADIFSAAIRWQFGGQR